MHAPSNKPTVQEAKPRINYSQLSTGIDSVEYGPADESQPEFPQRDLRFSSPATSMQFTSSIQSGTPMPSPMPLPSVSGDLRYFMDRPLSAPTEGYRADSWRDEYTDMDSPFFPDFTDTLHTYGPVHSADARMYYPMPRTNSPPSSRPYWYIWGGESFPESVQDPPVMPAPLQHPSIPEGCMPRYGYEDYPMSYFPPMPLYDPIKSIDRMSPMMMRHLDMHLARGEEDEAFTLSLIVRKEHEKWLEPVQKLHAAFGVSVQLSNNGSSMSNHTFWQSRSSSPIILAASFVIIAVGYPTAIRNPVIRYLALKSGISHSDIPSLCIGREGKVSFRFLIPHRLASRLIGIQGSTIQSIRSKLGVDIFAADAFLTAAAHSVFCIVAPNSDSTPRFLTCVALIALVGATVDYPNRLNKDVRADYEGILPTAELEIYEDMRVANSTHGRRQQHAN